MDVVLTLVVKVNDQELDKTNRARRKLGRQERSAYEEIEFAVINSLKETFVEKVTVGKPFDKLSTV